MNHFDAVDFSEYHSEEVISFFWRSVYKWTTASFIQLDDIEWPRMRYQEILPELGSHCMLKTKKWVQYDPGKSNVLWNIPWN